MTNPMDQLLVLKDVWMKTGVLHDLQIFQLRMWALCIFSKCKKSETHIDTDTWTIDFHIKPEFLASFRVPKDAPLRCAYVERWVHRILDGRVLVRVFWKSSLIFTGTRVTPVSGDKYLGTDFQAGEIVPEVPWKPNQKIKY